MKTLCTPLYLKERKKEWKPDKEAMGDIVAEFVSLWETTKDRRTLAFYGRELVDYCIAHFEMNEAEKERMYIIKATLAYNEHLHA